MHDMRVLRSRYGYPYPTSFYNPVPGYPFKVACERMVTDGTPLGALRAAVDVYYNYTGAAGKCFDQGMDAKLQRGKYVRSADGFNGQRGWGYQTCTEVFQPMPTVTTSKASAVACVVSRPSLTDVWDDRMASPTCCCRRPRTRRHSLQ